VCGQATVSFRVPHDRADDRDQLSSFNTECSGFIHWFDPAGFDDSESPVSLATLFERDAAFRNEVTPTLGSAGLFEHAGD